MADRDGSETSVPEDRLTVWPFAALVLAAAATLFGYAAASSPPSWLTRTVIVIVGAVPSGGHAVHIGLALLVVGRGLYVRRLMALYLISTAVVWSTTMSLITWDQPWRLLPMAAFAWALWGARHRFTAVPDTARIHTALHILLGLGILAVVVGGGGIFLQRNRLSSSLTPVGWGRELFDGLTANSGPMTIEGRSWFLHGLSLLGGATLLLVLMCLLAPARAPLPGTEAERDRVRRLVQHPDSDTLAPFALRHDKSYVFSPDGRAAIGYRVFLGTAVVGGDPFGAADAREAAVAAFLALCRRRGWRPAVLGAREELLPLWQAHGVRRGIGIGDEVMLDVAGFSLEGRSIRNVRQAVRRTHKAGITTRVLRESALDETEAEQLLGIHQRWLKGHAEHGFAMNLDAITSARHPDALLIVAYGPDGRAVGFQRYHPVGADRASGPTALSLDVMPRDPQSPNGVNERLIVDLVTWARERGIDEISLNFAAFRPIMDAGSRRTPLQSAAYRAIHLLDPWIMLESLYRFNAKFRPGWQPRSVMFRSWSEVGWLAASALAMEFSLPLDRRRVASAAKLARGHAVRGERGSGGGGGGLEDGGLGDDDAVGGPVRRHAG